MNFFIHKSSDRDGLYIGYGYGYSYDRPWRRGGNDFNYSEWKLMGFINDIIGFAKDVFHKTAIDEKDKEIEQSKNDFADIGKKLEKMENTKNIIEKEKLEIIKRFQELSFALDDFKKDSELKNKNSEKEREEIKNKYAKLKIKREKERDNFKKELMESSDLYEKALLITEGDSSLTNEEIKIDRDFLLSRGLKLSNRRQRQLDSEV